MSVVKRISLLCALSAVAGAAHAVGLGAIQLESSLNQPLRATVALRDVDPDTVSELRVRLAPAERFEAAGLIRDDYLRNLRLFTETDAQGQPVIRIRGEGPLREPMLDLLIEAREGRQTVQRGYTLLVDPPDIAREPAVGRAEAEREAEPEPEPVPEAEAARPPATEVPGDPEVATRPDPEIERRQQPEPAPTPEPAPSPEPTPEAAEAEPDFFDDDAPSVGRQLDPELLAEIARGADRPRARAAAPAAAPQPERSAVDGIYEVRPGETLWRVAFNTRDADADIAMAQQMLAIVIANPDAFDQGRIDRLMRGSRLEIPEADRVRGIDVDEADRLMAALSAGEQRTQEVDSELMRAAAPEEAATDTATAPEADPDVSPEATEPDTAEEQRDPDASALLADRALTEAQQRAAAEREAVDPVPTEEEADEAPAAVDAGPTATDAAEVAPAAPSDAPAATTGMNWQLILAGLAALFLLLALLLWRRRRAAEEAAMAEAEANDAQIMGSLSGSTASTAAASELSTADDPALAAEEDETASATAPAMTGEGDDPIADADFRIAYGMFDDAAERLQDAIRSEPERADLRLKLAEVHHAADQREAFLEAADAASGCGLDEAQRGELARMANRIAPDSRHASAAAAGAAFALGQASEAEPAVQADPDAEARPAPLGEFGDETEAGAADEADFSSEALSAAKPDVAVDDGAESSAAEPEGELDFDLEALDAGSASEAPRSGAEEETFATEAGDDRLDFDLDALDSGDTGLDAPPSEESTRRAADDNSLDFDLDDFSFDSEAESLDAPDEGGDASSDLLQGAAPELSDTSIESAAEPADDDAADLESFSLADFDLSGDDDKDLGAAIPDEQPPGASEAAPDADAGPQQAPELTEAPAGDVEATDDDFDVGDFELEPEGEVDGAPESAMAGNLEMAQAYLDMGEDELARPLLQEVAEKGDAEQQREAGELLQKLG